LPKYLTVQIMRFFWKQKIQKSAKIKRAIQFPDKFDVYELCTDELKAEIGKYRRDKLGLESDKKDDEKKADDKKDGDKAAAPKADENAMDVDSPKKPDEEEKEIDDSKKDEPPTDPVKVLLVSDGISVSAAGKIYTEGDKCFYTRDKSIWTISKINFEEQPPSLDIVKDGGKRSKNTTFDFVRPSDHQTTGYYKLLAVVTHKGQSANSGHYIGYVRTEDQGWLQFDDEYCSKLEEAHIKMLYGGTGDMQMGYMCFYERCESGEEELINQPSADKKKKK